MKQTLLPRRGLFRVSLVLSVIMTMMACEHKQKTVAELGMEATIKEGKEHDLIDSLELAAIHPSEETRELAEWISYMSPLKATYHPLLVKTKTDFDKFVNNSPDTVTALNLDFRNSPETVLPDLKMLSQFKNLEYLSVRGVEHLPTAIFKLSSLKILSTHTELDSIELIANLTALVELDFYWTRDILPPSIEKLEHLKTLKIGATQTFHQNIFRIPNLESLWITFSDSTELAGISNLKKLRYLETNIATREIARITTLKALELHETKTSTFPSALGNMKGIIALNISSNHAFVQAPEFVSQLENLEFLQIENCSKMVTIPDSYASLPRLKLLKLNDNESLKAAPANLSKIANIIKFRD